MNTPLILTSFALIAGVAARPIDNDRRSGDELRELVRSPDHGDQRAFLGRIPTGFDSLNSLQLHDIHEKTDVQAEDAMGRSTSPNLTTVTPSDPDPGLDSPYMGPQRHLANIEQELETTFLPTTSPPTPSDAEAKTEKPQPVSGGREPDYSPMVVPLVFASLAALVLLGLAVAVVYVTQLLRRTVLRQDVWQNIAQEKGRALWSEKEKEGTVDHNLNGREVESAITSREIPGMPISQSILEPTQSSDASMEDPELMPLPKDSPRISSSSVPALRDENRHTMGRALAAWTYDNWVTHFMVALFGWFGVFFAGARTDTRQ